MSPEVEDFLRKAELADVEFAIGGGGPSNPGRAPGFIVVDREELIAYMGDPTGFLARHHGGTREQYVAWCQADGCVRCTATTRAGRQCRNNVALYLELQEWVRMEQRGGRCTVHG